MTLKIDVGYGVTVNVAVALVLADRACTEYEPGVCDDGIVIMPTKVPWVSAIVCAARNPLKYRFTITFGVSPFPLTVVGVPGGPEFGESKICVGVDTITLNGTLVVTLGFATSCTLNVA